MKGYVKIYDKNHKVITEGSNHITKNMRKILCDWFHKVVIQGNDVEANESYRFHSIILSNNQINSSENVSYGNLELAEENIIENKLNEEINLTDDILISEDGEIIFKTTFTNSKSAQIFCDVCIIGKKPSNNIDKILIARYRRGEFCLSAGETYTIEYKLSF